jgi:hypothetical protein
VLKYALNKIPYGKPGAYEYETCMKYIIEHIFSDHFIGAEIEEQYSINRGRYKIDIKTSWKTNSILRKEIKEYGHKSSWMPIECKNYSDDLGTNEFGQIVMRCNKRHRHIGIITCRKIDDIDKLQESQQFILNNHEYIILVLDDDDINYLLSIIEKKQRYPPWSSEVNNTVTNVEEKDVVSRFILKRIEEVANNKKRKQASELLN